LSTVGKKPEGMRDWYYILIVGWCHILAVAYVLRLLFWHPLSWREEAARQGYISAVRAAESRKDNTNEQN
jgi:uncharacterized membrane protein